MYTSMYGRWRGVEASAQERGGGLQTIHSLVSPDGVMCLYVELSHWHMRINAVKKFIIQYFPLIYAFI